MSPSDQLKPYLPLGHPGQIRVVRLQPGAFPDPIICQLEHREVDKGSTYHALSYAWGDSTVTKIIMLEGFRHSVTLNLEHALRYLRHEHDVRILWVDAISIDQDNLVERNQQVQIMSLIYQRATNVLIWVGEEVPVDKQSLIPPLNENIIFSMDSKERLNTGVLFFCLNRLALNEDIQGITQFCRPWMLSLAEFFNRPWFQRLWVVQEAAANIKSLMICGNFVIPLFVLLAALERVLVTIGSIPGKEMYLLLDMLRNAFALKKCLIGDVNWTSDGFSVRRPFREERSTASRLATVLLSLGGRFKCSDPNDRIYGLLGLVANSAAPLETEFLKVDYGKDTQQLFRDVAMFLLHERPYLDILPLQHDKQFPDLPSWVPTWSDGTVGPKYDAASGVSPAKLRFSPDGSELHVQGIKIGKLIAVSDPVPAIESVSQVQNLFRHFEDYFFTLVESMGTYGGSAETLNAWKLLLLQGQGATPSNVLCGYKHIRSRLLEENKEHSTQTSILHEELIPFWYEAVMERLDYATISVPHELAQGGAVSLAKQACVRLKGKSLFLLDSGHFGIFPGEYNVETQGTVCLCLGGADPLVLERVGESFRLVGKCYLQGIMDQESQNSFFDGKQTEEFCVR